jgi:hypothetical protein
MDTKGFLGVIAALAGCLALFLILIGCSSVQPQEVAPTPTSPALPTPIPPTATLPLPAATPLPYGGLKEWDLVIISASGLWNVTGPYARLIEHDRGVKVVEHDETQGSLMARDMLKALQGDSGSSL